MKSSGLKNIIIYEYHQSTLFEFEIENSIEEIQLMLEEYESKELYLECAGIYTALQWIEFSILVEIIKLLDYQKLEIKIKDNDNRHNKKTSRDRDRDKLR